MTWSVRSMKPATSPLGIFERYLSVWVALAIAAGVALGNLLPGLFAAISRLEYANVNFVVAVLIWVMIYPMMIQIDFGAVRDVGRRPKGLIITLVVNWLIKPFTMAALASLFFLHVFAAWIPASRPASTSPGRSSSASRRARRWCSCGAS
jgi:ACR3 family arsenite transporter